MNGFERRKEQKMEQIRNAAFQAFSAHGFAGVSVNEIAKLAGVSPATIFNYFETKEGLFEHMLEHWLEAQLADYELLLRGDLSFPEKTKEIIRLEAQNLALLIGGFGIPNQGANGPIARIMRGPFEAKITFFFERLIALGRKEGYFRADVADEVLLSYLEMYKNELARQYGEREGQQPIPESRLEQWMELFFYGLAESR